MGSHLILVLFLCLALAIALLVVRVERKRRVTLMNLLHRVVGGDNPPRNRPEAADASEDFMDR